MRTIRYKSAPAINGRWGLLEPGKEYEVDDDVAAALVESGDADEVERSVSEPADPPAEAPAEGDGTAEPAEGRARSRRR